MLLDRRCKAALRARQTACGDAVWKQVDSNHVSSIEGILSGAKIV